MVHNKKRFRPRRALRGVPEAGRSLHLGQMLGLRGGTLRVLRGDRGIVGPAPDVKGGGACQRPRCAPASPGEALRVSGATTSSDDERGEGEAIEGEDKDGPRPQPGQQEADREHAAIAAATTKPTATATHSLPLSACSNSLRDPTRPAPSVIGVASRKLKRAAASRVRPSARPAVIVAPERLMPGSRASAWLKPMVRAFGVLRSASAAVARTDPIGDPQAHAPMTRKAAIASRTASLSPWRTLSMKSWPTKPMIAAGIVAMTSSQRQAAVAIVPDPSLADARDDGAEVAEPVTPEVDEQREQRSEVEEDVEGEAADDPRVGPAGDPRRQLEMRLTSSPG